MKLSACLSIMRPRQWLKNLMVFFPPLLSGSIFQPGVPILGAIPFAAFCFASSATYLVNDAVDATPDSCHPQKKFRPIPSGEVSRRQAFLLAGGLVAIALILGSYGAGNFLLYLSLYLG
ncbi:MAG: UbiA family prenyltransferase, partial [Desulfuromonadales bacterium]|nr:UbiA family prenyltransferase [Desulfuromonadales bacterium]